MFVVTRQMDRKVIGTEMVIKYLLLYKKNVILIKLK